MDLPLFHANSNLWRLGTAATPSGAAATTAQRRKRAHGTGHFAVPSLGYRREHRDGSPGRLFAVGAVGAGRAHGLQLFKLMVAGGAVILVKRHAGDLQNPVCGRRIKS